MNDKLNILINLIKENYIGEQIEIYKNDWVEVGLTNSDVKNIFRKLEKLKIIHDIQVVFATNEIKGTNPMQAKFISPATQEYNIPVYRFKVDKNKLNSLKTQKNDKKYLEVNEDIDLEVLGIKIKGNYILRNKEKIRINNTDKAIIYFLYYKSLSSSDECFSLEDLSKSKEINKSEKYTRNRITIINKKISEIISKIVKPKIGKLIVREHGGKYHFNPKYLHKNLKK